MNTFPAGTEALQALSPQRIINARFVTEYDKVTPKRCTACDENLVLGQAFAILTTAEKWVSYCAACAASPAAFAARLYSRVVAEGKAQAAEGVEIPEAIRTYVANAQAELRNLVANPADTGSFHGGIGYLFVAVRDLANLRTEAVRAERREALQADPLYAGLALATEWCRGKYQAVAESMVAQWETKGVLSERQRSYAEVIAEAARKAEAKAVVAPDWTVDLSNLITAAAIDDGYFAVPSVTATNDLTFVRIGTTDTGVRFMRHIVGGHPETTPSLAWCELVVTAITQVGTTEAMATYGREIGRCGACHRRLTDQVSRDRGIGPVCAEGLGF